MVEGVVAAPDDVTEDWPISGMLSAGAALGETYRVIRMIGAGGMGEVYEAEHLRLGRRVAVKILRRGSDQRAINRFRRETRVVASLESDHVVQVFDSGALPDGTPYLVMELLRGEDLRALLRQAKALPIQRAVRIVQQAARGVTAAHRAGIVHRDLKPENLFLARREGGTELCKVLDFGVAKTETSELTSQGTVIGTIKYMAPEQLEDSRTVGPATDVYALGTILYECLTGEAPHVADTAHEMMLKILTEPIRPVRLRRTDVPALLSEVLERALTRKAAERIQSAEELDQLLEPFTFGGEGAIPALALKETLDAPLAPLRGGAQARAGAHDAHKSHPVEAAPSQQDRGASLPRTPILRRRMPVLAASLLSALGGGLLVWLLVDRAEAPVEPPPPVATVTAEPPAPVPANALTTRDAGPERARAEEPDAGSSRPTVVAPAPRPRVVRPATRPAAPTPSGGLPAPRFQRENPYGE